MENDDVVRVRQPESAPAGGFVRTWLMDLQDVGEAVIRDVGLPMHADNVREVCADAARRGLRPTGDVTVHAVSPRTDGLTAVTYVVPVAPTNAAAAVHGATSSPVAVAGPPALEETVDPVPASEAPVPAPAWLPPDSDT